MHLDELFCLSGENFGNSEVDEFQSFGVFAGVEEVLWFDVSMAYAHRVQVMNSLHNIDKSLSGLLLGVTTVFGHRL